MACLALFLSRRVLTTSPPALPSSRQHSVAALSYHDKSYLMYSTIVFGLQMARAEVDEVGGVRGVCFRSPAFSVLFIPFLWNLLVQNVIEINFNGNKY